MVSKLPPKLFILPGLPVEVLKFRQTTKMLSTSTSLTRYGTLNVAFLSCVPRMNAVVPVDVILPDRLGSEISFLHSIYGPVLHGRVKGSKVLTEVG